MHRIDGPGATVDNKFTEGDPVGGIQATVVTDDWLNDVQEEVMSVLSAGGVTPVKGTQDQLLQSLYKLLQVQKATSFSAGGTATALTLTPSPAISAYATNQRFTVKFPVNSGLNPTLNVSAKGAKNLKQYDASGAKVAAAFAADQVGDVFYDGTDFVLLDPLRGNSQATEAVLGSVKIATQALVNAGTNDTDAVTALKLAQKDAYETVVSDWTTISVGGTITVNHPWGVLPQLATLEMKCLVANNGFTVGQEFPVSMHGSADGGTSSNSSPTGVYWTTTQVTARMGAATPMIITSPTSGVSVVAGSVGNFQIRLRVKK